MSHSLRLRKSCVLVVELIDVDAAEALAALALDDGRGTAAFAVAPERRRGGRDVEADRLRIDTTRFAHGLRAAVAARDGVVRFVMYDDR